MDLKRTLKENSYRAYDMVINRMRKAPFSQKQIRQIKPSDAKACTKKREAARRAAAAAWHERSKQFQSPAAFAAGLFHVLGWRAKPRPRPKNGKICRKSKKILVKAEK